ncbi:hypothetical protein L3X38_024282 [Prunus dulcis]|uniref:Integrase catalytic domain-containing protein n=1 Tax=Prunus dulcis TaxID=3755 RepID=A0AAD4Z6C4_PRUDU|nr:hypothetical protein L3X38_024282 [Prunus dulcis]
MKYNQKIILPILFDLVSKPGIGSNTWIIDTDASDHMTYDAKFFDELSSNTRDPYITSANGLPSPIIGEGTISHSYSVLVSFKCETCILAKSHRTVFPLSDSKAAKPFDLVYSDVWGLARVTSNGYRWFVTFIDDCTRLTWVFLLKNKHVVASILLKFCTIVSTLFHAWVKVFWTNNGGEYVNNTLASFFRAQGIIHQTTTLFIPQQNGVSERKNRQLLEVAPSLMLDMSVPHHLWGHVVLFAAYLINRTPSRVLDFKTPHDVFGDHVSPISVSKLPSKVFGCVAYVHVYSHQRSLAWRRLSGVETDPIRGVGCTGVWGDIMVVWYGRTWRRLSGVLTGPIRGVGSTGVWGDYVNYRENRLRYCPLEGKTCRTEASDRSPIYEDETCGPCEETTDRPLELNQSPIYGDEAGALGVETTGHTEYSDSCMDKFNAIASFALPVLQSTRDNESSEVISNDLSVSTYQLPPRTTCGKPKV